VPNAVGELLLARFTVCYVNTHTQANRILCSFD